MAWFMLWTVIAGIMSDNNNVLLEEHKRCRSTLKRATATKNPVVIKLAQHRYDKSRAKLKEHFRSK